LILGVDLSEENSYNEQTCGVTFLLCKKTEQASDNEEE